jgi:hypothetical protein
MTLEGIIRMAKEAGFADEEIDICQQILIHFATLVAQQEREACAKVVENILLAEGADVDDILLRLGEDIRARGQA